MQNSTEAYFNVLREAAPELMSIAGGKEARPPELDRMGAVFWFAGEKPETEPNKETVALL